MVNSAGKPNSERVNRVLIFILFIFFFATEFSGPNSELPYKSYEGQKSPHGKFIHNAYTVCGCLHRNGIVFGLVDITELLFCAKFLCVLKHVIVSPISHHV